MMVTQAVKDAITIRDAQNYEYPQGIDMIFVSGNGELFSIPRLVHIAKEES
jgi:alpha-D-ribose 1-methylphosphonate 5-triphosphate synthase subunit PhnH